MAVRKRPLSPAKPVVWFALFRQGVSKIDLLQRLLKEIKLDSSVSQGDLTAVKLHFGEEGNDTFLRPQFVRVVVDALKKAGAKPFLCDTNTLYTGQRRNAVDHLDLALRHGFGYEVTGAPILIADGLKSNDYRIVPIDGQFFQSVKIASSIVDADRLVVLSHFKGHVSAGFGGAIKNLAMGCCPALGKKEQHAARLVVDADRCIGCGRCFRNCPADAISMERPSHDTVARAEIDKDLCIGCSECMTHCSTHAILLNWGDPTKKADFSRRMAEYALGAVKGKERPLFINFLMDITPLCDCVGWSDAPVVPHIGMAASLDPVALDSACSDLVTEATGSDLESGVEKFCALHPVTVPQEQLNHGVVIGLGRRDYELVSL